MGLVAKSYCPVIPARYSSRSPSVICTKFVNRCVYISNKEVCRTSLCRTLRCRTMRAQTMNRWVSPTTTSSGQVHTPSTSESGKYGFPRPSPLQICKRPSLQRSVAYERNADKESHKVLQITSKTSSVRWRASLWQRPKNEKMQRLQECRTRICKRRSMHCKCRWQGLSHPTMQRLMW